MMKRFTEYQIAVGPKPEEVLAFYQYFAYKEGQAIECNSSDEAKLVSKNFEKVMVNKDSVKAYRATVQEWENKAKDLWYEDLIEAFKADYPIFKERLSVFNLIYSEAYARGHSSGYDEVANYFESYANFAEDIAKAMK